MSAAISYNGSSVDVPSDFNGEYLAEGAGSGLGSLAWHGNQGALSGTSTPSTSTGVGAVGPRHQSDDSTPPVPNKQRWSDTKRKQDMALEVMQRQVSNKRERDRVANAAAEAFRQGSGSRQTPDRRPRNQSGPWAARVFGQISELQIKVQDEREVDPLSQVFVEMCNMQEVSKNKILQTAQEMWGDTQAHLGDLRRGLEVHTREVDALRAQDHVGHILELRKVLEIQARETESLRTQETQNAAKSLKERIETCERMSTRRAKDTQAALEEMRDLLRTQAREVDEVKAQDMRNGIVPVKLKLEAQGESYSVVKQEMEGLKASVTEVTSSAEAVATRLAAVSAEWKSHQRISREELEQVMLMLPTQEQRDGLSKELESKRKRQVEHNAADSAWREQKARLQSEVSLKKKHIALLTVRLQEARGGSHGYKQLFFMARGARLPLLPWIAACSMVAAALAVGGALLHRGPKVRSPTFVPGLEQAWRLPSRPRPQHRRR